MLNVREKLHLDRALVSGHGVRIALIDTGIDTEHPDLADRVLVAESGSFTMIDDLLDRDGHGTHLAGIIAGTGRTSNGVYRGIAPGTDLISLKIKEGQRGRESAAIAAVEAAIDLGVDLINYSHGTVPWNAPAPPWIWPQQRAAIERAFEIASDRGILSVIAAGNRGPSASSITKPAGLRNVLTVGALNWSCNGLLPSSGRGPYLRSAEIRAGGIDRYDTRQHRISERAKKPDVVAPGEVTACRAGARRLGRPSQAGGKGPPADEMNDDPRYIRWSGTSQATAVVTGLAALALELLRREGADLTPNPGLILHRLMLRAASQLTAVHPEESGCGMVLWPMLAARIHD